MRAEEFILALSERAGSEEELRRLQKGVPLGKDEQGNIVFSQTREKPLAIRHTCVTGADRTAFIKRLVVALSCLYERSEINFLVLSPRVEYGELLRLNGLEVTVPYVRSKSDLAEVKRCVCELLELQTREKGCPKLALIFDGLEELDGCNQNGDLEEYRAFFELLARRENIEIISGVELMKSIFSGYPGAFVGVGNCLVTLRGDGKADVTYVGDDSSLSLPTTLVYPNEPTVAETIRFLNSLPVRKDGESA